MRDLEAAAQTIAIDTSIAAAKGDFEGYAANRYATPLVKTAQAQDILFQLAHWTLLQRMDWNFTEADERREKELRKKLATMAKRDGYMLTGQSAARAVDDLTSVRQTDPSARTTGRKRVFGRDKMDGIF